MVFSERIQVTLTGGAPWGFRLSGGGSLPLTINKIRKKSRAHTADLLEGDAVISINGVPVHDKTQDEALDLVEESGENLALQIFRGDVDDLSASKPKKPIQISGSSNSGFFLTASVDDVCSSDIRVVDDDSSELILTTSVEDVTSDTFNVGNDMSQSFRLTAIVDDVSGIVFDNASTMPSGLIVTASIDDVSGTVFDNASTMPSGLIVTASVDDVTSSSNQILESSPVISAHVGKMTTSSAIEDIQTSSSLTSVMAEPFVDSQIGRLSPNPLIISPNISSPIIVSHVSPATSPQPNRSPNPRYPPPVSPKPSHVTSSATSATFDDGQIRREMVREQHLATSEDSRSTSVVQRESTTNTTSNKREGPSFVMSHISAINDNAQVASSVQTAQRSTTSSSASTLKSTSLFNNQQGQVPASSFSPISSISSNQHQPWQPSAIPSSFSTSNIGQGSVGPVFKPSKFVPGPSKKEIPGLYATGSRRTANVSTVFKDGKENMAPAQSMFQVKNIVPEKSKGRSHDIWRPNVWLPDEQSDLHAAVHSQVASPRDDFNPYNIPPVPAVKPGVSLVEQQKKKLFESQMSKSDYDIKYDDVDNRSQRLHHQHHRLHVFAPPVVIHARDPAFPPHYDGGECDEFYYEEYYDEGLSSPDSDVANRNKKLYSDSAFYTTPGKSYPTIGEQMKLCKIIAKSLTSAANKRARGAKMFMRRKRKSSKWVHEGQSEWSSSAGDVANLYELESELSPNEGGHKPLMYFKIPNLKNRVSSEGKQPKMALSQEQFEKLRLNAKKCEHTAVAPDTCFDIVADLKAHKGRGGRMFERRKLRSDKFIIDNAQYRVPQSRLGTVLSQPIRKEKTPWMAAMEHGGNVDSAFSHISETERNQKLNQLLKYPPPRKPQTTPLPPGVTSAPLSPVVRSSLRFDGGPTLIKGKNFNRTAIGWGGCEEYPMAETVHHISPTRQLGPNQSSTPSQNDGNYNDKMKAWQGLGESPYVVGTPDQERQQHQWDQRRQGDRQAHQWAESTYERFGGGRQEVNQPRPMSWQGDSYNYRDEFNNYVPVDNTIASSDYQLAAYMQPIIPGTDL